MDVSRLTEMRSIMPISLRAKMCLTCPRSHHRHEVLRAAVHPVGLCVSGVFPIRAGIPTQVTFRRTAYQPTVPMLPVPRTVLRLLLVLLLLPPPAGSIPAQSPPLRRTPAWPQPRGGNGGGGVGDATAVAARPLLGRDAMAPKEARPCRSVLLARPSPCPAPSLCTYQWIFVLRFDRIACCA